MELSDIERAVKALDPDASVKVDKAGRAWIKVSADKIKEVLRELKSKGYNHLTAITGLDQVKEGVMELLYHLLPESKELPYLTVRASVPREDPKIDSITDIFPAALLYEDEVYDMLGVNFVGHPDLKRILLPEELPEGIHPLRKDFKGSIYKGVSK